jgi:uncharacterized membrane protein YbhN (UPF0104 family)
LGATTAQSTTARGVLPVLTSVVERRWTSSVFGIVAEGRTRRRPTDIGKLVASVIALALCAVAADEGTGIEEGVFSFLASLPGGLEPVFRFFFFLAPVVTAVLVLTALVARRVRLLGTQLVAVGLAWAVAVVLADLVDLPQSLEEAGLALHGYRPDFPVLLLAVSSAGILASRPYLTRPARRMLGACFWLAALSAAYLAEGLPLTVLGTLLVGTSAAAAAHLVFGSPAATPSTEQVTGSLAELGVEVEDLALADDQVWGRTSYVGGPDGRLTIEVVGRDSTDARLLAKIWRFLWYKDSGPTLTLARVNQVEHQAYALLLAGRTGARVPELVAAGVAGARDDALLVARNPEGRRLSEVEPDALTDAVVDDAWANLARLHEARIAHGSPGTPHVVLAADASTGLADLTDGLVSASPERMRLDAVQLLATTAEAVGTDRALAAAERALGTDGLGDLLALLETSALTPSSKRQLAEPKARLKELRDAGAERAGVDAPKPTELRRFSLSSVFLAAAFALGVYLLVGQLAGVAAMGDIFEGAIWGWILLTFLLAQLPQFSQSITMIGAVSAPLPFGPVVGVQFANAFTGLVGGTAGNATLNIRFFQKQGLPVAVAVSSGLLNSLAGFAAQALLVVVGLALTGSEFDLNTDGDSIPGWVLAVLVLVALTVLVALLVPRVRTRVRNVVEPQWRAAMDNLRGLLSTPRKAVELFGGSLLTQLLFAMVLGAALHAYGESLPLLQIVVINCFASFIGGAAPVPGGMGVVEAGLIGGFTAAGISQADAVAATFTARMFTSYLPPIWGWFSLSWLRHRDLV